MKKDIWLKPGKELNTGAIIGGIGFAIYIACPHWNGGGLRCSRRLPSAWRRDMPSSPHWTAGKRIKIPSATTSCGAPARWRS